MLDPYENILIGNFLYSLGARSAFRCAQLGIDLQGAICLLQQTPLDGEIGDVCIQHPGTIRILEFKREVNRSQKEARKLQQLRIALKGREYVNLEPLSRRVHWYVESIEDVPVWRTRARPYLDLAKPSPSDLNIAQLTEQLAGVAVGASQPEFASEDIARYLKALATFSGTKGTSSSGIIVAIDSTGQIRWLPLESVRDLRLTLSKQMSNTKHIVAEMGRAREAALEAEQAQDVARARTRRHELDRDRGHSL